MVSPNLHREIHWVAFAVTGFALSLLAPNGRQELRNIIGACLLGMCLESLQYLIYGSALEWSDVRDDCLAVFAGFVVSRLARAHVSSLSLAPRTGEASQL